MKYIASVSFGKDSLAMLLMLIEKNLPLDEVVFYDTGVEFQAIYNIRDQAMPLLRERGIQYTELQPKLLFMYQMLEKPVSSKQNGLHNGYSWCGGPARWGTAEKTSMLDKHKKGEHIAYIGIAADETHRIQKERAGNKRLPLVDWQMTEADCLQYCYDRGFEWKEGDVRLYDILDRVSCWCCKNKNLKELKGMYRHLPQYWERLRQLQSQTERPMKGPGKSVFDLEKRFAAEIEAEASQLDIFGGEAI